MEELERRREAVLAHNYDKNAPEAVFIFSRERVDKNFFYITGLENGVFENCGVVFDRRGRNFILTSTLEEEAARAAEAHSEIIVYKNEKEREERLKSVLSGYRTVGMNFSAVSHSFFLYMKESFSGIELVDASRAFKTVRMIKSREEIERIRIACGIASRVAEMIPGILKEGMTELELSAEIDYLMKRNGAAAPSFKTIAAFGKSSSMPHYSSAGVPLKNGDVVLVDFGAEHKGYSSDITQTYLTGKPQKELLDLYGAVHGAQRRALELITDGANVEEIEQEVRSCIDSREEYRGRFIHRLGHSIGLDVHDDGYPAEDFGRQFAESMVLTVEPGIYLPGIHGIRLEDDIVVRKSGCEVLTTAKKECRFYELR